MTDNTDKTRDAPISIRLPADQREEFRRNVEASGLPTNAYVVRAILNLTIPRGTRHPPVEKQMLAQLRTSGAGPLELGAVGQQFGLLSMAQREFDKLAKDFPRSPDAAKLLEHVTSLRGR